MLFGQREDFAIECYHDPIPNEAGRVFGRICVWANNIQIGTTNEPACILGTLQSCFSKCLSELPSLWDAEVDNLSDDDAFEFLNRAIYSDDARTSEQIEMDARRYSKFVFLTNWSEAFDGTNAFLLRSPTGFRILFRLRNDEHGSASIARSGLVSAIEQFLRWIAAETPRGSIQ
jgi:hypothetical protein